MAFEPATELPWTPATVLHLAAARGEWTRKV